jgi:hypothetical protein
MRLEMAAVWCGDGGVERRSEAEQRGEAPLMGVAVAWRDNLNGGAQHKEKPMAHDGR